MIFFFEFDEMTAVGATAVFATAVRNDLKSKTINNIGSTIIL